MDIRYMCRGPVVVLAIELLMAFVPIPGVFAAINARKLYQKWRQRKAIAGWLTTEATIQSGKVHSEGRRNYWAEMTYIYYIGEYRVGRHVKHFRKEEEAADFVRQLRDKRIQVRYDERKPDDSVLLERDLEMIVLLEPELR